MYLASEEANLAPRRLRRLGDDYSLPEEEDVLLSGTAANKASALRLGITCMCDFVVEEITYPTAQHAFQAQKFSDGSDKEYVASLTLMEAVAEGRRASIYVAEWDANKAKLMYSLIKEQATQNSSMIDTLVDKKRVRRLLAKDAV